MLAAGPALAAGDVVVTNTETIQAHLDATGKVKDARVYDQLAFTGQGKVDVANPVSTKGLRNLDGFGGYDVKDGKLVTKVDVDGDKGDKTKPPFRRADGGSRDLDRHGLPSGKGRISKRELARDLGLFALVSPESGRPGLGCALAKIVAIVRHVRAPPFRGFNLCSACRRLTGVEAAQSVPAEYRPNARVTSKLYCQTAQALKEAL